MRLVCALSYLRLGCAEFLELFALDGGKTLLTSRRVFQRTCCRESFVNASPVKRLHASPGRCGRGGQEKEKEKEEGPSCVLRI